MAAVMRPQGFTIIETAQYSMPLSPFPYKPEMKRMLEYNLRYFPAAATAMLQRFVAPEHSLEQVGEMQRLHYKFYASVGQKPA